MCNPYYMIFLAALAEETRLILNYFIFIFNFMELNGTFRGLCIIDSYYCEGNSIYPYILLILVYINYVSVNERSE